MQILSSWKNSVALFAGQQLYLVSLVTLKSFVKTVEILARFWWFLYLFLAVVIFTPLAELLTIIIPDMHALFIVVSLMINSIASCMIFFTLLTLRSSVLPKNYAYFFIYLKKFWYLMPFIFLFNLFIPLSCMSGICWLFSFIWMLFLVDDGGSIWAIGSSARRTAQMIFYNAPLFLVISLLFYPIFWLNHYLFSGIAINIFIIETLVILPVWASIITTLYINRVHDQSELYFVTAK